MNSTAPRPRRRGPEQPVISVGNLAMGGRGKTPVVALVARLLAAAGEKPAILSRGYKRRIPEDGVVIVSDGVRMLADLDRSGDEPLMLARQVPGAAVLVCDVRATAAAVAERVVGATAHILDDGFQHRIERDIDIVLVAPDDLRGRPLPFGRLRSPVSALAAADAVIVDGPAGPDVIAEVRSHLRNGTPVFELKRRLGSPAWIGSEQVELSAGTPVAALAGIANPARFAAALVHAGFHVVHGLTFPDHHQYDDRDIRRIVVETGSHGAAAVLTTEKDAVRLLPWRPLPVPVAAVPLEASVEPAEDFRAWLSRRLAEVRQCA